MKKLLNLPLLFVFILISCSSNSNTKEETAKPDSKQKVLLIGFDGIRSDVFKLLLESGKLPNLKAIIDSGVYFEKGTTSDLTGSWGGWCDVVRGVHRDKHEAGYWGQNVDPGANIPEFIAYPDVFSRLEAYDSKLNTVSFISWSNLHNSLDKADERVFTNYNENGDDLVTAEAITKLANENPDVVFFYQADTDIDGHNNGFGPNVIATSLSQFSTAYINSIINADKNAGKVLNTLKARDGVKDGSEKWLILFTSDHGGTNGGHSQNRVAERHVPIIIGGYNITLPTPITGAEKVDVNPKNIDIVPSILSHLNIPESSNAWKDLDGYNIVDIIEYKRDLSIDKNLLFNGDAEYDRGFNGQDETIRNGGSKAGERDWPNEALYWDQTVSGWDDWTETPSTKSMTVAFYDSGDNDTETFPQQNVSSNIDGGKNFFCAGLDSDSVMQQIIDVSSLVASANSYELSGYLGGSKSDLSNASLTVTFLNSNGVEISSSEVIGASALERNNITTLIKKSKSASIPSGTHSVKITLKVNGKYGFADNISFMLKS